MFVGLYHRFGFGLGGALFLLLVLRHFEIKRKSRHGFASNCRFSQIGNKERDSV